MKKIFVIFLALLPAALFSQAITNVLVASYSGDGECTIVINPASPNNILAAANPDVMYRSSDGGLTWTPFNLSTFSSVGLIGDITLAADLNGNYYCQDLDGQLLFRTLKSTDMDVT
jgi:hypothetical protein